ncbi:MAG: general secretion pathway protein GspB [Halieaceae bacterium]|jgi:cytoskeletal protein RodZ|nr:general secretion pathway protein GspB [Halieaceae bacterium]
MSFILDALNRSNSEPRDAAPVPGLQTRHGSPSPRPGARRWLWLILVVIALLAAVSAWLWWGNRVAPDRVAPDRVAPDRVTPDARTDTRDTPASVPQSPGAPRKAAKPALSADVAALYEEQEAGGNTPRSRTPVAAEPPDAAVRSETPVQDTTPAAAAADRVAVADEPAAETTAQPPARSNSAVDQRAGNASRDATSAEEESLDIEALARLAEAELARQREQEAAVVVESTVPLLSTLRQSIKDEIPSIYYQEHRWATDPRQRSVILNRKRYAEGQRVAPGLTLVEILEGGVVMDYQGTEFRLRSLSSWVNL